MFSKKITVLILFLFVAFLNTKVFATTFSYGGLSANIDIPASGSSAQSYASPYESQITSAQCASSQNFLTVSFVPDSTGDINLSAVLNGQTYSFSGISQVCDDGFAVCSPGTNENCQFYKWSYPGALTASPVAMLGNLAGCYCINDSCAIAGQPLSSSPSATDQILYQLGGGIEGALMSAGGFEIGSGTVNGYSITYSGALSNCSATNPYLNGGGNLQSYYNPYGGNTLDSEVPQSSENNADSSLGNTYFGGNTATETLNNIQNETFGGNTPETCNIKNIVTLNSDIFYSPPTFRPVSLTSGDDQVAIGVGGAAGIASNGHICDSSSNSICVEINVSNHWYHCGYLAISSSLYYNGTSIYGTGGCSGSIQVDPYTGAQAGTISCFTNNGGCGWSPSVTFSGEGSYLLVGGYVGGIINLSSLYQYFPVYSQPVNSCVSFENNSNCKLQSKQVCSEGGSNCVTTVSNYNYTPVSIPQDISVYTDRVFDQNNNTYFDYIFNGTGSAITAYPSADYSDTSGQETLYTSSAPFGGDGYFNINETYVCDNNAQFNFNAVKSNQTQVENSALSSYNGGKNNGNINYSYKGYNNGNNYSGNMPQLSANSEPGYSCIVKVPVPNTKVSNSGGMTGTQVTPSVATVYKEESVACTGTSPNYVCPDNGDILVQGCEPDGSTNSDSFIKATVKMMIMDKLAQDLVCSQ